ncbi:hypothetical protein BpHYR1_004162 [Brachionus plicatilis]|uniref:Uncharacterized protein n=1 Tax=Brachionus plicatilis TaxID=10195 RepID=A0A3M7RNU4_BRAPC|nr:hypothetical protein BpHYR1_004162 [Brachionus plicatilis]
MWEIKIDLVLRRKKLKILTSEISYKNKKLLIRVKISIKIPPHFDHIFKMLYFSGLVIVVVVVVSAVYKAALWQLVVLVMATYFLSSSISASVDRSPPSLRGLMSVNSGFKLVNRIRLCYLRGINLCQCLITLNKKGRQKYVFLNIYHYFGDECINKTEHFVLKQRIISSKRKLFMIDYKKIKY